MASRLASTRTPPLLTVADVAAQLNISTKTVRRMIARDELPAHRIGGQLRIAPTELGLVMNRSRTGVSV
jgi:excisionase family DNA binding protein